MIKMGKLNIDIQSHFKETFVRPHGFCLVALQTNSRYKAEKKMLLFYTVSKAMDQSIKKN